MSDHDARALADLLNLLDMLPPSGQDPDFSAKLATAQQRGWYGNYPIKNLEYRRRKLRGGISEDDIHELASYCLMFFGSGDDELWTLLDRVEGSFSLRDKGDLGATLGSVGRGRRVDVVRTPRSPPAPGPTCAGR